ncbi:MAG: DUF3418 domain-containing protein [Propionibacteriaceae bacterium]|nr:DUF3418 domain-containing protein [Propionibacteriaceae bacterium]
MPKAVRARLTPVGQTAARALDWLDQQGPDQSRPFTEELSRALLALTGVETGPWDLGAAPNHLKLALLVEPAGPTVAPRTGPGGAAAEPAPARPGQSEEAATAPEQGAGPGQSAEWSYDLALAQAATAPRLRRRLARIDPGPIRQGLSWVFGHLPEQVQLDLDGVASTAYPGLRDDRTTVSQILSPALAEAQGLHRLGLSRLVWEVLPDPTRWTVAHLAQADRLALASAPYDSWAAFLAEARRASLQQLLDQIGPAWAVRDQAGFDALVDQARPQAAARMAQLVQVAAETLRRRAGLAAALDQVAATRSGQDLRAQLDDLIFPGFLRVIPQPWFDRLPTYLRGIERRLDQIRTDPARDLARLDQLEPVLDAYAELCLSQPVGSEATRRIGYLIEELRLQLFAQPLKTWQTVSVKRLLQAIAAARTPAGTPSAGTP